MLGGAARAAHLRQNPVHVIMYMQILFIYIIYLNAHVFVNERFTIYPPDISNTK